MIERDIGWCRAQRLDDKKWIEGYHFRQWDNNFLSWGTINAAPNTAQVDARTICEYTQQVDMSQKRIFDHDLLDCGDRIVEVRWHKHCKKWDCEFVKYIDNGSAPRDRSYEKWSENVTKIGNTLENKENVMSENVDKGEISDGFHTFNELYYHRMCLFSVIVNQSTDAWKSKHHHDGTMYPNMFIVGLKTPDGDITYHYERQHWDKFNCKEINHAPEWDGHTPDDVCERLLAMNDTDEFDMECLVDKLTNHEFELDIEFDLQSLTVVRLITSYYQSGTSMVAKKELRYLKRKSHGWNILEEDSNNMGENEVLPRIVNLNNVADGIYEVRTCNEELDRETGVLDEYDYVLVPHTN